MILPTQVHFHKKSQMLELAFDDGTHNSLSAEFLRVHSPSAEVRGHGIGQEKLQVGKSQVQILDIQPSGNYALKIVFSDGHDSGLYDWKYLAHLCRDQASLWQQYLVKLESIGASREPQFISATQLK
ncbi:gamma-butyrobetaine hydroxylase-like domain-containing protein [Gynuella sp.]|uniref:gamma-butyrobetaine hydroxylase-like domain-containing protein n=1 Tax=Gynuella sp. TaxID=2969146 RepID=UPI003D126594